MMVKGVRSKKPRCSSLVSEKQKWLEAESRNIAFGEGGRPLHRALPPSPLKAPVRLGRGRVCRGEGAISLKLERELCMYILYICFPNISLGKTPPSPPSPPSPTPPKTDPWAVGLSGCLLPQKPRITELD